MRMSIAFVWLATGGEAPCRQVDTVATGIQPASRYAWKNETRAVPLSRGGFLFGDPFLRSPLEKGTGTVPYEISEDFFSWLKHGASPLLQLAYGLSRHVASGCYPGSTQKQETLLGGEGRGEGFAGLQSRKLSQERNSLSRFISTPRQLSRSVRAGTVRCR